MKNLLFSFIIGALFLVACSDSEDQKRTSGVRALNLAEEASCTKQGIFQCTGAEGGLACFSRCGVEPNADYCSMDKLNSCLDQQKGASCYRDYCGSSVGGSGPFYPANGGGLTKLPAQGYGFETYDVDYMRYGQPKTIARIQELAARVFNKTGYKLFVGDLSNSSGGNSGRHAGHLSGLEIDFAIMGNTPTIKCYTIWDGCYLRNLQKVFVQEVIDMGGVTGFYFNDTQIQSLFPGWVSSSKNHDNHIHVNWHN